MTDQNAAGIGVAGSQIASANNNALSPIIVPASPTQPQIAAGLRQIILALGSIITALESMGIGDKFLPAIGVNLNNLLGYVGGAAMVTAFVWGQLATRSSAKKAAVMATALPNAIAQTK